MTSDGIAPGSHEQDLVVTVDRSGRAVDTCTVEEAHRRPARLHRAFSVVLMDETGRILLQRRAAVKTRFALRWANACCGHPRPGENLAAAATRRLQAEIGIGQVTLTQAGVYIYYAVDPQTDRVEFEYDHVLTGMLSASDAFSPNPAEVADLRWTPSDQLYDVIEAEPNAYAPWLAGVLAQLRESESPAVEAYHGPRGTGSRM
jgi:isopentenyl-diphosphate delta-isomerase